MHSPPPGVHACPTPMSFPGSPGWMHMFPPLDELDALPDEDELADVDPPLPVDASSHPMSPATPPTPAMRRK